MQTFLNKIANFSLEKYQNQLGDLTIVLPNRRAIVFLKEEFKKEMSGAGWLPTFYSLEDFIANLGGYVELDATDLIFKLYAVHLEIEKKNAESFEEFMSWGITLLQDFNEIDRYLVEGNELFGFLTEAKALEIWELEEGGLTEFQHKYLQFWTKLGRYYQLFTQRLKAENEVYQGLGFRIVAEKLTNDKISTAHIKHIVFAGFNALTQAEIKILKYFEKQGNAEILWDADEYYLNDNMQEAGNFLRQHQFQFNNSFKWISNNLANDEKNIKLYGVNGNVAQAKLIGHLLKDESNPAAVVLADEELLLPVLESLPQVQSSTNVTMGYPISYSPVFSWVESWLSLYLNSVEENKIKSIYYKDVKNVFNDSISQYLKESVVQEFDSLTKKIDQEKIISIETIQFNTVEKHLAINLFQHQTMSPQVLIDIVLQLLDKLRVQGFKNLDVLNLECINEIEKCFNRLKRLGKNSEYLDSIKALVEIYKQLISTQSVSFVGEPLGGIQIMGVLESRTLDFENIIISSVNEGVLPSGKSQNSFIPFDIKRKFNLPSYHEKDAIFAYHFYRLLQRAKTINIIYNTKVDQLQGGERSRFIEQLLLEFNSKNTNSTIEELVISTPPINQLAKINSIKVNDLAKKKIQNKIENKLSASSLNTLIACPLDFYYKYVLHLNDEGTFEEKIQDNTLGTVVHDTLFELYHPLKNKEIIQQDLKDLLKRLDETLRLEFLKTAQTTAAYGNHKLTYEVAKKFITNQIKLDLKLIKAGHALTILELEKDYSHQFKLPHTKHQITLYGKIDRIDRLNRNKRIIDYKTGSVTKGDLVYKDIDSILLGNKPKVIQLMLYKYLLDSTLENDVEVGIVSLRNISSGFLKFDKENWKEDFMEVLESAINSIYNSEELEHRLTSKYCNFCQ